MAKNFTDLTGRVAVVIGGTSGIGKSMALGFAQAGADVIPTGRREANVSEVCELVKAEGRDTLAHTVDGHKNAPATLPYHGKHLFQLFTILPTGPLNRGSFFVD